MSQYTKVDVYYTLGKVVDTLVDAIQDVEGRSQQYDPEDVAQVLCEESNGLALKALSACEKAVYLMELLTPSGIFELETAHDDFSTLLRNPEKLVELWPDIYENAHALESIARERVNTYKQLLQSAYDSDMLLVNIPQDACRFCVTDENADEPPAAFVYYGHDEGDF